MSKKSIRITLWCMAVVLLLATACVANAVSNLVLNSTFETENAEKPGEPTNWSKMIKDIEGEAHWLHDLDFGSGKALRVRATAHNPVQSAYGQIEWQTEWTELPTSTLELEVSAWIKAEGIVVGEKNWYTLRFSIAFRDDELKSLGGIDTVSVDGTFDWTKFQRTVVVPEGATSFRLFFGFRGCTGTAWLSQPSVAVSN